MRITYKQIKGDHIVVANNTTIHCISSRQAWELIFELRREIG